MYQPIQKVEKHKLYWIYFYSIIGSAVAATVMTWLFIKYGQSPPPFTTAANFTFDENNNYTLDFGNVNSDTDLCSKMGRWVLKKNGSAVDSAITTMICNGILSPSTMGIGGGFLMTIYDRKNEQAHFLNAKDKAPLAVEENMVNDANEESSEFGSLAIGVPGEIAGYWEAHQKFGKLAWFDLFEPNICLCEEKIKSRPIFCKTMKIIADKGANEFYNGRLGEMMIEDLNDLGIIMTIEDLKNYRVEWTDPAVTNSLNGKKLFTSNLPGSGELLVLMSRDPDFTDMTDSLKNITSKDFARNIKDKVDDERTWNESSHYGWADNLLKNHRISQISVIAPNGDAVAVTSRFNGHFGSGYVSEKTGVILNKAMDDFLFPSVINTAYSSSESDKNDKVEGEKQLSLSIIPLIITTSNGDVRMVIGADDGTQITTSTVNDHHLNLYNLQLTKILSTMDKNPNVNKPCDDFYQFSCGGFLNSNDPNPLTKLTIDKINDLAVLLDQNIEENDHHYVKLAKIYYKDCLVAAKNPTNLINVDEAWPIITRNEEKHFNFNKTTIKISDEMEWTNLFFKIDLNSFSIIEIAPNILEHQVYEYHDKMTKLASSFYKGSEFNTKIEEIIKQVSKFGTDLVNMKLLRKHYKSSPISKEVSFYELKKYYDFFDWEGYINHLHGTTVERTTKFVIKNIIYMDNLKYLLRSTNEMILANFFAWMIHDNNNQIIDNLKSKHWFYIVSEKLPMSLLAIYYQNIYLGDERDKNQILPIVFDIKEQVLKMVSESTFIDDFTRKLLLKKIKSLGYVTDFPQILSDNSIINKFYENLKFFEKDNFMDKTNRINIFNQKSALTQNNYWRFLDWSLLEYNAIYFRHFNFIVYSPLYQNVYFHKDNPMFVNYGTIGRTVGHETIHALRKVEEPYDHYVNKQKMWTSQSLVDYDQKCSCLIEQYENYKLPGMIKNADRTYTLEENIADLGGIKAAYRAYIKKSESSNNNERLPGINYTPRQMFWISYAQSKCQKVKEENLHEDVHAPPQFRVNGPLSNMEEFSNDFNCPTGSNMNPIKKCTVW